MKAEKRHRRTEIARDGEDETGKSLTSVPTKARGRDVSYKWLFHEGPIEGVGCDGFEIGFEGRGEEKNGGDVGLTHFHSSTISGSAARMISRTFTSVFRASPPRSSRKFLDLLVDECGGRFHRDGLFHVPAPTLALILAEFTLLALTQEGSPFAAEKRTGSA
jgi:hypothetical protein